jgi:hypothetical protein
LRGTGKMFGLKEVIPANETWTYSNGFDQVEFTGGGRQ